MPGGFTLRIAALAAAFVLPASSARAQDTAKPGAAPSGPQGPPPSARFIDRADVSLVLVPVVVRDERGRPVTDLAREDFTVLDEGAPQPITAFSRESRPVSILVALDTSDSMRPFAMAAKRAAIDFVRGQREGIAFAISVFNNSVFLESDFRADRGGIERSIASVETEGDQTALFDALSAAARHLEGRDGGRVAVVFTDGTETVHPQDEAEERLGAAIDDAVRRDVSVYTVAFGPRAATSVLRRVSDETGGEAVVAAGAGELSAAFARIGESVGSRYLLGYPPPAPPAKGYRAIEVKVARPGAQVTARRRYFLR